MKTLAVFLFVVSAMLALGFGAPQQGTSLDAPNAGTSGLDGNFKESPLRQNIDKEGDAGVPDDIEALFMSKQASRRVGRSSISTRQPCVTGYVLGPNGRCQKMVATEHDRIYREDDTELSRGKRAGISGRRVQNTPRGCRSGSQDTSSLRMDLAGS